MKHTKRLYWIVTSLMAAFMLMASVPDLLQIPQAVEISGTSDIQPICSPFLVLPRSSGRRQTRYGRRLDAAIRDDVYHLLTAMRYPADHKQATRERIVRAAARRFRSRGSDGAAISDLMRDLRLTHGGFYRHFGSKEDLFTEAFEHGVQQVSERLMKAAETALRGGELKAIIDSYLSMEHCHDVANGCPVAAMVSELARRKSGARSALLQAVRAHIERMARYVPGDTDEERVRKTVTLFSGMAGTLSIARAMPDDVRRRRVLDDARTFYLKAAGA